VLAALPLAGLVSVAAVLVCIPFIGFFHGFVAPTGLAGVVSVHPEIAGAGAALAGFLQIGASAEISMVMGMLVYDTQLPMALVMLAAALTGLLATLAVRRT